MTTESCAPHPLNHRYIEIQLTFVMSTTLALKILILYVLGKYETMLFVVILLQAFQLKAPILTVDTNINHIQMIIMYRCITVVDWMFYVPVAVFNDLTMTSGKSHTYPLCSTVSSLSYRL